MDHDAPQEEEGVQAGADMLEEVQVAEAFPVLTGASPAQGSLGATPRQPVMLPYSHYK